MQPLPAGALRLVHLSDAHLSGDGALHQGVVDTTAALDRVLAQAGRVEAVRLLVGSGDLSDDGSEASYRLLRDRVDAWADARGAAVALVPGNHDLREGFRAVLGDGHGRASGDRRAGGDGRASGDRRPGGRDRQEARGASGATGPAGAARGSGADPLPVDGASEVDGWRVLTLDTSVPRAGYGLLRPEQLAALRARLATPAPHGTVLVLHHPPLPAPTTLHQALALQHPEELAAAIEGSDVRVVLAGHYHHHLAGQLAGVPVPVLVAPAVANETDLAAPAGTERAVRGSGCLVVDVHPSGEVSSAVLRVAGPDDGAEVFAFDEDQVRAIAAAAGVPRP